MGTLVGTLVGTSVGTPVGAHWRISGHTGASVTGGGRGLSDAIEVRAGGASVDRPFASVQSPASRIHQMFDFGKFWEACAPAGILLSSSTCTTNHSIANECDSCTNSGTTSLIKKAPINANRKKISGHKQLPDPPY